MKAYGVVDGLLIALVVSLGLTLILVTRGAPSLYFWLLPFAIAIICALGSVLGYRKGEGLVDGAFMQPWLRLGIVIACICCLVALPTVMWVKLQKGTVSCVDASCSTPTPENVKKLDEEFCARLKDSDLAEFEKAAKAGVSFSRDKVIALQQTNLNFQCGFEKRIKSALQASIPAKQSLGVPDKEIDEAKALVPTLDKMANKQPSESFPTQQGTSQKPPPPPIWSTPARDPDDTSQPANPVATPVQQPDGNAFLQMLLKIFGLSIGFGQTSVSSEDIAGAIRSALGGDGTHIAEIEEKLKDDRRATAMLRILIRRYANSLEESKRTALESTLDKNADVQICHYVLSRLPNAPDPKTVSSIAPPRGIDSVLRNTPREVWETTIKKARECVYAADRPNLEAYEIIFQELGTRRAQLRA